MNTLIILPGLNRDARSYKNLVRQAPKSWKIITVSYKTLLSGLNLNEFKISFQEYLHKDNLSSVYILGHSTGGALAMEFAHHHPSKVKGLFLVDSEGIYGAESLRKMVVNLLANLISQGKFIESLKVVFNLIADPLLSLRLAHYAHHASLEKEAASIKIPTLILWGERDRITPLWQGEKLHQLIPTSKLIVFKGQGHDWIVNSPELFWKYLRLHPKGVIGS